MLFGLLFFFFLLQITFTRTRTNTYTLSHSNHGAAYVRTNCQCVRRALVVVVVGVNNLRGGDWAGCCLSLSLLLSVFRVKDAHSFSLLRTHSHRDLTRFIFYFLLQHKNTQNWISFSWKLAFFWQHLKHVLSWPRERVIFSAVFIQEKQLFWLLLLTLTAIK